MDTAAKPATAPTLSIDVDSLTDKSQLKSLLKSSARPAFQFFADLAPYIGKPIADLPSGVKMGISISQNAAWTTTTGIGFSLTPQITSSLEIITSGAVLNYAPGLKSEETDGCLPADPYPGYAYLKLSLDFIIAGTVSGTGNVGALGICGNATGSAEKGAVYCHRIAGTTDLADAIRSVFENFVFNLEPSSALTLPVNDLAQSTFRGNFGLNLALSYGIDNIKFSAPDAASALQSATRGIVQLRPPSGSVDIGANASIAYSHSDDFSAILEKRGDDDAYFNILRAHKDDLSGKLGIAAEVTLDSCTVKCDPAKLKQGIDKLTDGLGGDQAAAVATSLQDKLNGKLNSFVGQLTKGGAGASLGFDLTHAKTLLLQYRISLKDPALLAQSWTALCRGDLDGACGSGAGALHPLPGSGLENDLSRSCTLDLHLFNFFSATDTSTYFNKTTVTVTDTGDLRYLCDFGDESQAQIKDALSDCRIHFVVTAELSALGVVSHAQADLHLDLTAKQDPREAGRIANCIGSLPSDPQIESAQAAMAQFARTNPHATLNLTCILKGSAYARLSCSPFTGVKHDVPPAEQQQDMQNWSAFYTGCLQLVQLPYMRGFNYEWWRRFNRIANNGSDDGKPGNRRHAGDLDAVLASFWPDTTNSALEAKLLLNTADFMNLCDDLHGMAGLIGEIDTKTQWNALLGNLERLIHRDTDTDYSKPAVYALLALSRPSQIDYKPESGKDCLTCTLTLS